MAADEMGRHRDGVRDKVEVKELRRLEPEEELGFPMGPNTPKSLPRSSLANRQDRVSMAKIRLQLGFPI
ncbi:F-box protein PP2-A12-like [Pyrus ussuriensis x Pyrus communis]|uniref:F-box protein PP2-A12-like n=1 Tax=Pyrus ussuriensis x Pyrus communis TaxID=2448454 RepID=A0A5N5F960_9ROSA|nr:F-box protein PP2-A12-like [Pyrus ussuriensis x Pyrus communis]